MNILCEFTTRLKQRAQELGFVLCGITPAASPGRIQQFNEWLDAGYAGQMHYLEDRREAYTHPQFVLEGCRSVVMLAVPYSSSDQSSSPPKDGTNAKIARYARGPIDYHDVIHDRLKVMKNWILEAHPKSLVRGVVDTAPLLEREFAELAGLGWVGKNTLLLNRQWGSYFFLAALLTDLELTADSPNEKGYCGTCTACLDACPTEAFPQPFVLDASKCISYLTIEHRDHIADDLKERLSGWIFGCDICQEVCPWNRKEKPNDPAFSPAQEQIDAIAILEMSEDDFRNRFRATAMWRSKRRGILRNAILIAGAQKQGAALDAFYKLLHDEEPLLRAASAWALSRLQPADWIDRVRSAMSAETDSQVHMEMQHLLSD